MKPEKSQERDMKLGRRKKLKKQFPCPLTKKSKRPQTGKGQVIRSSDPIQLET